MLNDSGFMDIKLERDEKETSHMAMDSFIIKLEERGTTKQVHIATTGKQTLHEAISQEVKPPRNFDKMFVKKGDVYFNLGLPSGVLVEEGGIYECLFPKGMPRKVCAKENIRQYNVGSFSKVWMRELRFFYIIFEVSVSQFHGYFRKEKVRVDFFVGEGLYEALYRDGRLNLDKLRCCEIFCKEDNATVSLKQYADYYHDKHLIVKRVLSQPNTDLPSSVSPQPCPLSCPLDKAIAQENESSSASPADSHVAVKKEAKDDSEENLPNTSVVPAAAQSSPQGPVLTSSVALEKISIKNDADLVAFVRERFGLDVNQKKKKLEEKKRLETINKFTGKFANKRYHRSYTKDMDQLMEIKKSVGAICATAEGTTLVYGTCFRVGPIYILTCYHVIKYLKEANISVDDIFITFNFEVQPLESLWLRKCSLFKEGQVMFLSEELDFALLKMDFSEHLPPPITSYGYELDTTGFQLPEGKGLTLIGHPGPGNEPKQIDTFCPIEHNELAKQHSWYIKHGPTYHVTSFGHSSSGSPGMDVETKKVIAIHSRGIPLDGHYSIEQGIMVSSVIEYVKQKCVGTSMDIEDFFGELPEPKAPFSLTPQFSEPMEM